MARLRSSLKATVTEQKIPAGEADTTSPLILQEGQRSIPPPDGPGSRLTLIPPGSRLPDLSIKEQNLLREKQKHLAFKSTASCTDLRDRSDLRNVLASTLIFAQHEAGTAVCIDPRGWVLTCSHCFGESDTEWRDYRYKWLLFSNGLAAEVECRIWDPRRDLALAKIIKLEARPDLRIASFRFVSLASSCSNRESILCVGQPGQDDLEASPTAPPRTTGYDFLHVSAGKLRGMVPGRDPQDNSEIGVLKHDAWTYWGHSGAPLLRASDGALVGLHSSWDDQTAMRHGIPLVAIRNFLHEHLPDTTDESAPAGANAKCSETSLKQEVIVLEDCD